MESTNILSTQLMRIINKLIFLEKRSIFEYQGIKLYPSEIHLMQVVATSPHLPAVEMAKLLGVTKGAVSQTMTRLVNKGIVHKEKNPEQGKKLSVTFTELGQAALEYHAEQNRILFDEYESYLSAVSRDERAVIQAFLKNVEMFVDRLG